MIISYYPLAIDSGGGGGGGGNVINNIDEGEIFMGQPVTRFNVRGINADVDAGTEDVHSAGGTLSIPTAAAATKVKSDSANDTSAGTGARTIRVIGLDDDDRKLVETATMNGTNDVNLTNQFKRVLLVEVLTAGSGAANAGVITVQHGATVIASMVIGANRTQTAFFSAYANLKSWMITKIFAQVLSVDDGDDVSLSLLTRKSGGVWQVRWVGKVSESLSAPIPLDAGEDVIMRATATSANQSVSAGFDVIGSSTPL